MRKFLTAGIKDSDSIDFRKLQFLANFISLVLMVAFTALTLINSVIILLLLSQRLSIFSEIIYNVVHISALVLLLAFHLIRLKTGNLRYVLGTYYCMLAVLFVQSLLMGEYAKVHLSLFGAAVVPVFFLEIISFREFITHAGFSFLLIFGVFIWFHYHPYGLLPQQTSFSLPTTMLVISVTFFVNVLLAYYMWKQNQRSKHELMEQKSIVQGQHELLMRKDEYLQMELDFAFRIQQSILPPSEFHWQQIRIRSQFKPVAKVSGDYYEIRSSDNTLFVMIADVSGHGVPAALVTMLCKQIFSAAISSDKLPSEIIRESSMTLWELIHRTAFITVFLMKIHDNLRAVYCNAGHNHPLYFPESGKFHQKLNSPGAAIGLFEPDKLKYADREIQLCRGDRIFLYTDGLTEQKNHKGEEFGIDRMISQLSTPDHEIEKLFSEVEKHKGNQPPEDDMTLVCVEIL